MSQCDQVCRILRATLGLGERPLTRETQLLGSLPELDSMAVANLLLALEEHYGFEIEDDEISAQHFATVDSLSMFVESKLA